MTQAKQQPASGRDPIRVDEKHYKVVFENDQVRVLRIHYEPHEKSVMHWHPESVGIMLRNNHARFTFPDGTTQEMKAEAGEVQHYPAGDHLPENLGDQPLDAVLVELKR